MGSTGDFPGERGYTFENYTKTHHRDTYAALEESQTEYAVAGKSVFITGGGTGIGKAIAISFSRAGARAVFLTGRTVETLETAKTQILLASPKCTVECYGMDVCNSEQVSSAFESASKSGPIDILVSNAGYVSYIEKTKDASFDKIWDHFEINVKGAMLVYLAFMKYAPEKGATIINVSSGAAVINYAEGLGAYSASKTATLKMMDYINREEAGRELRVFNIHPGVVQTAMASAGNSVVVDTAELPGNYAVWLSTPDADFLKGRFVYVNWDIEQLRARREEIVRDNLLTLTVKGMDTTEWKA